MSATLKDARQRRTYAALVEAILTLAAEQPLREVSVSQLARTAGVHRSTVYQHAESPQALLSAVFTAELDAVRDEFVVNQDSSNLSVAQRLVVLAVLEHLERHAVIYRRELAEPSNHLHAMLREHFEVSVDMMMEQHYLGMNVRNGVPKAMFRKLASRWIADASVGAMTAWLLGPEPRNPEHYLAASRALTPRWWPAASE